MKKSASVVLAVLVVLFAVTAMATTLLSEEQFLGKAKEGFEESFYESEGTWLWSGKLTLNKADRGVDFYLIGKEEGGLREPITSVDELAKTLGFRSQGKKVPTCFVAWRDENGDCFMAVNANLGGYEKSLLWQIQPQDQERWTAWDTDTIGTATKTWVKSDEPVFTLIKFGKIGDDPSWMKNILYNLIQLRVGENFEEVELLELK